MRGYYRLAAAAGLLVPLIAFAQVKAITPSSVPTAGIKVSPALESLSLPAGKATASYQATVTNDSQQLTAISLSAKDFTSVGVAGQISFISPQAASAAQHQLASSLTFSQSQFALQPHASQSVTVTVNGVQQLDTGGHYAAVLFSSAAVGSNGDSSQHVHFQQTVASLLFATTAGQGTYHLGLDVALPAIAWIHFPSIVNLLFNNSGNVQTTPRGYLTISGPFHEQIKTIVNPNSALVLSGTQRLLQTKVGADHRPFWPGIYTIHAYYRTDNVTNFQQTTTHFVYFNLANVLAIIFVFSLAGYVGRTMIASVQRRRRKSL